MFLFRIFISFAMSSRIFRARFQSRNIPPHLCPFSLWFMSSSFERWSRLTQLLLCDFLGLSQRALSQITDELATKANYSLVRPCFSDPSSDKGCVGRVLPPTSDEFIKAETDLPFQGWALRDSPFERSPRIPNVVLRAGELVRIFDWGYFSPFLGVESTAMKSASGSCIRGFLHHRRLVVRHKYRIQLWTYVSDYQWKHSSWSFSSDACTIHVSCDIDAYLNSQSPEDQIRTEQTLLRAWRTGELYTYVSLEFQYLEHRKYGHYFPDTLHISLAYLPPMASVDVVKLQHMLQDLHLHANWLFVVVHIQYIYTMHIYTCAYCIILCMLLMGRFVSC